MWLAGAPAGTPALPAPRAPRARACQRSHPPPALHHRTPPFARAQTIHAVRRDGTILKGTEALKTLYQSVDMGWAAQLGDLPIISTVRARACCRRRVRLLLLFPAAERARRGLCAVVGAA